MEAANQGLDLEKELTCSICTEVLYQPLTLLDCLHTFCGACLKEWFNFQLKSSRSSPSPPPAGSTPFTCPSCRAPVRATKNNATVTTLLEMFLAANPDKNRTPDEREDVKKKYTPGENVMPKVEEREKTLRERRAEDEDRRLVSQVQAASLREVGVETPEERRDRRRRREERARVSGRRSSRDGSRETSREGGTEVRERRRMAEGDSESEGGRRREERAMASAASVTTLHPETTGTADRRRRRSREEAARRSQDETRRRNDEVNQTAVRQIEHQSSLRSLISSSDVDSHEMEEEILRQIREEGLLDGIDLENIDVSQEDQISERIAEAFRRRQRERLPAVAATRTRDRSASDRTDHRSATSNRSNQITTMTPPITTRRRPHSRSLSATSQADEATRASPRASATHLEPQSSDEGRRRRRPTSASNRSARSATSPTPSSSPATRPATRSQTDLTERPRSSHTTPTRPIIFAETRSTTEPPSTSATVADVVELATGRRRPPTLPSRGQVVVEAENTASPVDLQASHSRTTSHASTPISSPVPSTATQMAAHPGLIPIPTSPQHHTSASERATALQAAGRPTSSSSAGSHRVSHPRFPEPSIRCNRCFKQHIEYSLHYSCTICAGGDWNICLSCYRSGRGCEHWFGFGYAAWAKWEKLRASGQIPLDAQKPHMLFAERYLPPKITPGGAEGRRTLTTEDPARRLQSGAFCANCLAWANECYWRCDVCNEGDWGFCNCCVNQGRSCTHPLLPLLYKPDNYDAEALSPSYEHPTPSTATLLTGPGVVELGSFKPLSFRVECDVCHYPIQPTQTRFHCFQCTSALPGREAGDYDICTTCYHTMVNKKRISNENGHLGWRRCLQAHRMIVVGFEDSRSGQRRVVVQDLVGGRGLFEEPASNLGTEELELQQWSWAEGTKVRLVTNSVGATAPIAGVGAAATREFPPDGGVGMTAVALWSWYPKEGEGANELLFPRGAEVREVVDVNGDWFHGVYMGSKGLFPAPYVRILDKNL